VRQPHWTYVFRGEVGGTPLMSHGGVRAWTRVGAERKARQRAFQNGFMSAESRDQALGVCALSLKRLLA
jgi:hypothetical protein